ncbi:MAG TPA: peptide-methionine (R)-S-oxide reductase MsrB [Sphingomicrobium sp.]|nr:peptide-methionine (R)-S-oxide reductase MsrB [Sphingomicrobium sp.]
MPRPMLTRRELIASGAVGLTLIAIGWAGDAKDRAHFEITHSADEWKRKLGAKRYAVLREAATERAGSSPLLDEHRRGTFVCAGCGLPLYSSATKFESGTGWPSFYKPLRNAVVTRADHSLLMERTEVLCRRCGGHLGHVFNDGPKPTGLRYCMNGLALRFVAA